MSLISKRLISKPFLSLELQYVHPRLAASRKVHGWLFQPTHTKVNTQVLSPPANVNENHSSRGTLYPDCSIQVHHMVGVTSPAARFPSLYPHPLITCTSTTHKNTCWPHSTTALSHHTRVMYTDHVKTLCKLTTILTSSSAICCNVPNSVTPTHYFT